MPVQIVLKNYRGSRGIESLLSAPPVAVANRESALGLPARQALVFANHGERGSRLEGVYERGGVRCIGRRRPIEARWHADEQN